MTSRLGWCKTWTLDSGLDSWTGLWTETWTGFWTDTQFNDDHFQQCCIEWPRLCTSNCLPSMLKDKATVYAVYATLNKQSVPRHCLFLHLGSFKIRHKH